MATARKLHPGTSDDVEAIEPTREEIEPTREEYDRAVKDALAGLGLTHRQLQAQARKGRFSSLRARMLWLAIGEPRGAR